MDERPKIPTTTGSEEGMGDDPSPGRAAVLPGSVTVVVLNWNGMGDTLTCLHSLMACRYRPLEVLVVDNGSRLSPAQAIRDEFHGDIPVRVVEHPTNLGYAGGNNLGIRMALAGGAEFVWVLNNDTEVHPEALDRLVDSARRNPSAGAFGPKILRGDDPEQLWLAYGRITWRQSLIALEGEDQADDGRFDDEKTVEWIPGCAILFRAAALDEVGTFDEDFFAYHEDVDWATRASQAGWTSRYVGSAQIHHHIHGSSGGVAHYGGFRKYLSARNSVLYARKHGGFLQCMLLATSILITLPFQFLRRLPTGEAAGVSIKVRGWIDGALGRPVPFRRLGLR